MHWNTSQILVEGNKSSCFGKWAYGGENDSGLQEGEGNMPPLLISDPGYCSALPEHAHIFPYLFFLAVFSFPFSILRLRFSGGSFLFPFVFHFIISSRQKKQQKTACDQNGQNRQKCGKPVWHRNRVPYFTKFEFCCEKEEGRARIFFSSRRSRNFLPAERIPRGQVPGKKDGSSSFAIVADMIFFPVSYSPVFRRQWEEAASSSV